MDGGLRLTPKVGDIVLYDGQRFLVLEVVGILLSGLGQDGQIHPLIEMRCEVVKLSNMKFAMNYAWARGFLAGFNKAKEGTDGSQD